MVTAPLFMNDAAHNERELAHWKAWQSKADAVWGWQTPAGQARASRRALLFRERAHLTAESDVLEVGCGTGEFTLRMAPHVKQLSATDLSPDLLARAQEKAGQGGMNKLTFENQDVTAMTFPSDRFDAVFGCSMLHHVDAPRALGEIFRVLKPGGWCSFSEPNMLNPQIALQKNINFLKRRVGDSPDETAFFRGELQRHLAAAGFTEIAVSHFDFLHPFTSPEWIPHVERLGNFLEKCPGLRALSGSLIFGARKPVLHSPRVSES